MNAVSALRSRRFYVSFIFPTYAGKGVFWIGASTDAEPTARSQEFLLILKITHGEVFFIGPEQLLTSSDHFVLNYRTRRNMCQAQAMLQRRERIALTAFLHTKATR